MIRLIKSLLPFSLKRDVKDHLGVPSMHWSLLNLKRLGYRPKMAADIGAYEGQWTKDFLEVFPGTKVLMAEAQPEKEVMLQKVKAAYPGVEFTISVLSSEENKKIIFNENETASHISESKQLTQQQGQKEYFTKTLDGIIEKSAMGLPDFLKLDVQGHEIEVLKGGATALKNATFCLLEVTMISLGDKSPLIAEVIRFMGENNYQVYDILQFMRRPFDKALYQADVLFIKKDSPYVSEKRWN